MEELEKQDENLMGILKRSVHYRGIILHDFSLLEKVLDDFLVTFFVQDKRRYGDFIVIVLDRTSFDNKIAMLETILQKGGKDDYKKHHEKLCKELRIIKSNRNAFAHYVVDLNSERINRFPKEIYLVSYRNSEEYMMYSDHTVDLLLNRIQRCGDEIKSRTDIIKGA